jgi:hypothetical protein
MNSDACVLEKSLIMREVRIQIPMPAGAAPPAQTLPTAPPAPSAAASPAAHASPAAASPVAPTTRNR